MIGIIYKMSASKKIFSKYLNPVFIETGSCDGDGIQLAIDAGFKTIYSIELAPEHYNHCVERFKHNPNVNLIFGDSRIVLSDLLSNINEPITFWLDAHYYEDSVCALLQEIEAIDRHPIKTHILMIDDIRDLVNYGLGLNVDVLKQKISSINPDYKFTFEDGYIPNDILIARV
jgi:hypothetical protein